VKFATTGKTDTNAATLMMTDEQLMLEFQCGLREAFTELFDRYRQPIYGYFRRRLPDAARAEELAQETFLAVLRAVNRYEPRALFRTYLYGIATLQLAAERRKNSYPETNAHLNPPDAQDAADTDSALAVRQALERLAPDDREVLMLREYEQLSYAEIAALQRVPINTVRSRLFHARQALKETLLGPTAAKPSVAQGH
jgi:RNA polymerase sigma-70 factor (ECF subfamily)